MSGDIILHMCTVNENHMMYSSWDMECKRQNFVSFQPLFLLFYSPNNPAKQTFEKKKKAPGYISSFYKTVPQMTITWCMVPQIWSVTQFFVILDHFLPFYNPSNQKTQIFEKMKKSPGDIIILHKRNKSCDHMLYCCSDMERNRCICCFSFWAFFGSFTPLTDRKIKNFKNWQKLLDIWSFYTCVPKIMIRWSKVPEIWCTMDGRNHRRTDAQMEKVIYCLCCFKMTDL